MYTPVQYCDIFEMLIFVLYHRDRPHFCLGCAVDDKYDNLDPVQALESKLS